jgi:hypothetical protein
MKFSKIHKKLSTNIILNTLLIYIVPSTTYIVCNLDDEQLSLDAIALQTGTDKSTAFHAYTLVYDKLFSELRHKPIKFLEIGIQNGFSVHMWDKYFDNLHASLHFIDIDPNAVTFCKQKQQSHLISHRAKFYIADQENKENLKQFITIADEKFDIIIDDGGHTMIQQQNSFEILFPYLKKGGIYIIEDLHTSYWQQRSNIEYGGGDQNSTINFLLNLVHDINTVGAQSECADFKKFDRTQFKNYYQEHIESIIFHSSLCFITKR